MRVHKTKYSNLTNEELLKLADQQGFNISELGLEFMDRLIEYIETPNNEIIELENEITRLEEEINDLNDEIDNLQETIREVYIEIK